MPTSEPERKHHPYSPSSLAYREACPCYAPKESKHERTTAGTLAHEVVETGEDNQKLGDKDAVAAAECIDFMDGRRKLLEAEAAEAINQAVATGAAAALPLFKVEELVEVYLPVDDEKFDDADCTTGGYVDRVLINYNRTYAEMLDWKFGYWQVADAADNIQGICYVLGLFRKYPSVQRIRFFFKQPHLDLLTDAVFDRTQIPDLYLRVQAIVLRAREAKRLGDFSTAKAYVPVCNFCANLGRCPIGLGNALKVCKKFHPVDFPDEITPTMVLDPHQTSLAMRLSQVLKIWCDAFKRQVSDRVLRGEADMPEGYALQQRDGMRDIADLKKFKEVCLRYVTPEQYETCLSASFGPLEDIVSEKAPRGQKKAMVEEFNDALEKSGCLKRGMPFSFLRVKATKKEVS